LARASNAGVLGILKAHNSQLVNAILTNGQALDASLATEVLGDLAGPQIASAFGAGALTDRGTGSGGGGTGEGLRGLGRLATLGRGGGGSAVGAGWDRGAGRLATRRPHVPEILIGETSVHGSLDKEIVRRIIRRHINEVRFCYEEALRKQPRLGGRIGVQFTIAGSGQVLASVLQ